MDQIVTLLTDLLGSFSADGETTPPPVAETPAE
jgi:hypothetical protein